MDEPDPAVRATSPHSGLRRATTERAILDCLAAEDGPLTRAELARRTAISPPAISEAVRRMESDAVLVAVGLKGVKRGIPPVPSDTVKNLTSSAE